MRNASIIRLAFLLCATAARAIEPAPDSATTSPSYLRPAVEILAINLGMSTYNRFVRDVEYARIDPETIWHNLAHEWVWDDNNFQVNQVGHPIQGGLYYSTARANGHGYLGSLAYTTVGSIHWEYFMETEPPAVNDLVTTRMGGAMVGEVTWRLAEYLAGESTNEHVGWLRKSSAFLVNPIFGMDRLLNGTPVRRTQRGPSKLLGLRVTTGRTIGKGLTRTRGAVDEPSAEVPLATTNIRLAHGDPFLATKPFDHFSLNLGLSVLTNPVANISLRAQLWSTHSMGTEQGKHVFALAQNYDYLNSAIYKLSANSFGAEWMSEFGLGDRWILRSRVQPIFIALGAASTEYYLNVERDYNLGLGGGWKTALALRKPGMGLVTASSDRYWIHTQSGAAGDEVIDLHSLEIQKDLYKALGLGVSYHIYNRSGYYTDHPNVSIFNHEFRVIATATL